MSEIKPVAWTIEEQLEKVNSGRIGFIANRDMITPAADIPLYDQSAIDRLTAERDAAVADAERYRWIRLRIGGREAVEDDFKWEYQSGECLAQEVDAAIDAAMQHASDGGAT